MNSDLTIWVGPEMQRIAWKAIKTRQNDLVGWVLEVLLVQKGLESAGTKKIEIILCGLQYQMVCKVIEVRETMLGY